MGEISALSMRAKMELFAEYIRPGVSFVLYGAEGSLGQFEIVSVPDFSCTCDHGLKIFTYGEDIAERKIVRLYSLDLSVGVDGDQLTITDEPRPGELKVEELVIKRIVITKSK